MKKGLLTIDDGPGRITGTIIKYLQLKKIPAIMFFIGVNLEEYWDTAQLAVKSGFLIGNHSYTHPHFSELSFDQCRKEIVETDRLIEKLYESCGISEYPRLFRFPFLDKGGDRKESIQELLHTLSYRNIDIINYNWFKEEGLDKDFDLFVSFDYQDYLLTDEKITFEDIFRHLEDKNPESGGSLFDKSSDDIFLMHDHPWLSDKYEAYYEKYLDKTVEMGVDFICPECGKV